MYWKTVLDGYLESIGTGVGDNPIEEEEYNAIIFVIQNRPNPPDGYDYRLREDLTWELYELPPEEVDPDPELTDAEALAILLGEAE